MHHTFLIETSGTAFRALQKKKRINVGEETKSSKDQDSLWCKNKMYRRVNSLGQLQQPADLQTYFIFCFLIISV